ncbi:DUF4124 domain-containing protein [Lysobacter humi (ex Lee et al. 2017)]
MRRPVRFALLPLGLALATFALAAGAGELYQWKDAKGVTHYSDAPPPGQKHTTRRMDARPAPVAAAKPVVNADCSNARNNLKLLQGTGKLGVDDNNDGKLDRELTTSERAGRLKMAEGQIEIYCDAPAANAAATAAAAKTR